MAYFTKTYVINILKFFGKKYLKLFVSSIFFLYNSTISNNNILKFTLYRVILRRI